MHKNKFFEFISVRRYRCSMLPKPLPERLRQALR
jgi:hypothetical protein